MNNLNNGKSVGLLVTELVLGVLLVAKPMAFTEIIVAIVGIIIGIFGVVELITYFQQGPGRMNFVTGIICLILGAFLAIRSRWIVYTLSSLIFIVAGIVLLVNGLVKVQWTVDLLRMKTNWISTGISAAISILAAVILILNPFSTAEMIWRFIGVALIVMGVTDIIAVYLKNRDKQDDIIDID